MFLKTDDRLINLVNVSSINVSGTRIIFNMNYSIELDLRGKKKLISDYVYWDSNTNEEMLQKLETIKLLNDSAFNFDDLFFEKPHNTGFINIEEVSSIKFIDEKLRVIVNLSHTISYMDKRGNTSLTSDFVYVNSRSRDDYDVFKEYVQSVAV